MTFITDQFSNLNMDNVNAVYNALAINTWNQRDEKMIIYILLSSVSYIDIEL